MSRRCCRTGCNELGTHPVQLRLPGDRRPWSEWLCTAHRAEAHQLGTLVDRLTGQLVDPDQPIPGARPVPTSLTASTPADVDPDDTVADAPVPPEIVPPPPPPQPEEPMTPTPRDPPAPRTAWSDAILHDVLGHHGSSAREVTTRTGASNSHSYLRDLCRRGQLRRERGDDGVLRYWPAERSQARPPDEDATATEPHDRAEIVPDDTEVDPRPAPPEPSAGEDEERAPSTSGPSAREAAYSQAVHALEGEIEELDLEAETLADLVASLERRHQRLRTRREAVAETLGMLRRLADGPLRLEAA